MNDSERAELLKLVDTDYERTAKFIDSTAGIGGAIRGWAITVWLAITGAAITARLWELSALGAIVILVFGVVDAYHAVLYDEALLHAKSLEQVTVLRYRAISSGADDPDAEPDLERALVSQKFGVYANLRRFKLRDFLHLNPWVFFYVLYPALAVIGIVGAIFIGVALSSSQGTTVTDRR